MPWPLRLAHETGSYEHLEHAIGQLHAKMHERLGLDDLVGADEQAVGVDVDGAAGDVAAGAVPGDGELDGKAFGSAHAATLSKRRAVRRLL